MVGLSTASMESVSGWWHQINESTQWQDSVFYFLCAAYGLVSAIALVRLLNYIPACRPYYQLLWGLSADFQHF
ncbi:hypothetical protein KSP40_PGU019012 [Platanthera guangdongensis]|uniref:THH1/TOM1/TOM3 domain-containing protein n=1 Tax=Platanthera guangdongensis TaxID=2320717 RepID=A0ABR2MWZ2_9ASPA